MDVWWRDEMDRCDGETRWRDDGEMMDIWWIYDGEMGERWRVCFVVDREGLRVVARVVALVRPT